MPLTHTRDEHRAPAPPISAPPPLHATMHGLQQESALIVAILRAALTMLAAFALQFISLAPQSSRTMQMTILAAIVYTGVVFLFHALRWRPRGMVQVLALLDILLVTAWVGLTWQKELHGSGSLLFPFYYILIIVNALWFGVAGALASSLIIATLYLGMVNYVIAPGDAQVLIETVYRNVLYLFLTAIVIGYLVDTHKREREMWTRSQVLLAQYQERFRAAQEVYDLLVPAQIPAVPGVELAGRWRPVLQEGGGDFYDVIPLPDGRVVFTIADVSGKHMRGAIKLPIFKSAFLACAQVWDDPGDILAQVNRIVYPLLQPDMFISACVVMLDPVARRITLANAGQDPPILVRAADSAIIHLETGGLVLGVDTHADYPAESHPLAPGDTLCLYTDGITEARDDAGEEFGAENLEARVRAGVGIDLSAQAIADNIFDAVTTHIQGGPRRDDLTLLVMRFTPE